MKNTYNVEEKKEGCIRIIEPSVKEGFFTQMKSLNYSYATIKTYKYPLDKFLIFLVNQGIERIQEVTLDTIEKYRLVLTREKFKSASLEVYLRTVKLLFKYLESSGEVFANIANKILIPKPDKHLQYVPTIKEINTFLDIDTSTPVRLRNKAILETAYSCGARLNELRMIDLKDSDLANGQLRLFGKGGKERIVPIGKHAVKWLEKYIIDARPDLQGDRKHDEALFLTRRGNRISRVGFQKLIEYCQEETGVHISMHAIRRACATHMLQGGAHPMEIQALLGHSGMKHLTQYLKVTIDDLQKTHSKYKPGR